MVVFAVDISRRMMELRGTSLQCGRRTLLSQQCNSINGMARLTSRQGRLRRSGSERYPDLCGGSGIRIEQLVGLKHRMHYYRQFAHPKRTSPLQQLESALRGKVDLARTPGQYRPLSTSGHRNVRSEIPEVSNSKHRAL